MRSFYMFKSSNENDDMTTLIVIATSAKKALAYAFNYFSNHNFLGMPQMLSI